MADNEGIRSPFQTQPTAPMRAYSCLTKGWITW
jgi:hypothetical protein